MPAPAAAREKQALPEHDQWLTKPDAAKALAVSLRQIERLAETGRLTRRNLPPAKGDRYHRTVYSADDVARVKAQRDAGIRPGFAAGFVPGAPSNALAPPPLSEGQLMLSRGYASVQEALVGALAAIADRVAPSERKAWLTLDEASDYSGLPVPELVRLVRSRELYAIGRGRGTWRIQRNDLDVWSNSEHRRAKRRR
jgi:excisionase family DNA binding protein